MSQIDNIIYKGTAYKCPPHIDMPVSIVIHDGKVRLQEDSPTDYSALVNKIIIGKEVKMCFNKIQLRLCLPRYGRNDLHYILTNNDINQLYEKLKVSGVEEIPFPKK